MYVPSLYPQFQSPISINQFGPLFFNIDCSHLHSNWISFIQLTSFLSFSFFLFLLSLSLSLFFFFSFSLAMKPTTADQKAQLACTLATLILADEKIAITAEKISSILGASSIEVAPYWPGLFKNTFASANVKALVLNAPVTAAAGPAAATATGAATAAAAEEKPKEEEKKQESEADVGAGGLFGDDGADGADY